MYINFITSAARMELWKRVNENLCHPWDSEATRNKKLNKEINNIKCARLSSMFTGNQGAFDDSTIKF